MPVPDADSVVVQFHSRLLKALGTWPTCIEMKPLISANLKRVSKAGLPREPDVKLKRPFEAF